MAGPYVANLNIGLIVRIDYADVAGAYGGWFLLNVDGVFLVPGFSAPSTLVAYNKIVGAGGPADPLYQDRFFALVHARLEKMLGVGHAATWTATFIESVTPATTNDVF